eukprot:TRINITY_DN2249_c0_g1_i1.p1 TRINITY_DN2249_c0_g1~~TRINITY_DN2249_c0_g1_i1.p1  ORF type:complete len:323 (+),score=77.49 TRINITY_DN2249_c0_g1_i1:55-969(+)
MGSQKDSRVQLVVIFCLMAAVLFVTVFRHPSPTLNDLDVEVSHNSHMGKSSASFAPASARHVLSNQTEVWKARHPYANLLPVEHLQTNALKKWTKDGFRALYLPADLEKRLDTFYHTNLPTAEAEEERMHSGFIWADPGVRGSAQGPLVVDMHLLNRDPTLYNDVVAHVKAVLEAWTGELGLTHRALFGIREYRRGSILKQHVDRYRTHVLSCIVHVGQRGMDAPWPLQVYAHGDQKPRNVLMGNGYPNLVMYESATLVHGREDPLRGDGYANIFVHFSPAGWDQYADREVHQVALAHGIADPE